MNQCPNFEVIEQKPNDYKSDVRPIKPQAFLH